MPCFNELERKDASKYHAVVRCRFDEHWFWRAKMSALRESSAASTTLYAI